MKKILFPVFMILFVVGGAVAADFIRNSGSPDSATAHASDKGAHAKGDKKKDKKGKKGAKGKNGDGSDGGSISYLKFKRQFVVPVMKRGKIDALVIMNLNVELNDKAPDNAYSYEPKLRDAIMRELLSLSDGDMFGSGLTSAESYETLRATLVRASKAVLPEGVEDILILDIARQEQ